MSEKIEAFWQDATADDVARVMAGETVEARFRNSKKREWENGNLRGWSQVEQDKRFWDQRAYQWLKCQVYREPSWYTDKPDPGPGFRLLEKLPDEEPKPGDECFGVSGEWGPSCQAKDGGHQVFGIWYRRRIEPVEPKFSVGQTVRVVGPKEKPAKDWGKEMDRQIGFAGVIRSIPLIEGEGTFYNLEGVGIWCFREDYLEAMEPEPKHYVLRVGDSVETPNGHRVQVISRSETQRFWSLNAGDRLTLPSGQTITITAKGYEVTQ
jgi:hypothetical protein